MTAKAKLIVGSAIVGLCVFDSFLIDPALLVAIGMLITFVCAKRLPDDDVIRRSCVRSFGVLSIIVFWWVSVSLYLNLAWVGWMWQLVGAHSGRDWMLNSGIFHFEFENPSLATNIVAGFLYATYPVWLIIGIRLGRIIFGAKKNHKGLLGLFIGNLPFRDA